MDGIVDGWVVAWMDGVFGGVQVRVTVFSSKHVIFPFWEFYRLSSPKWAGLGLGLGWIT
jgi:hypothetical protein